MRDQWSAEEKRAIVEEYENAPHGSKGGVLRRHGVSQSRVYTWASYRDAGVLETGLKKGWQHRMTPRSESAEITRLRAEIGRLERELDKTKRDKVLAEAAADALGKASALLHTMLQSAEQQETEQGPSSPSGPC